MQKKGHSQKDHNLVFKTNYLQLSLNAGLKYFRMLQWEHSAILLTFSKLPFVIKIFVLSISEWPFYTGFTVTIKLLMSHIQLTSSILSSAAVIGDILNNFSQNFLLGRVTLWDIWTEIQFYRAVMHDLGLVARKPFFGV